MKNEKEYNELVSHIVEIAKEIRNSQKVSLTTDQDIIGHVHIKMAGLNLPESVKDLFER